MSTEQKQQKQLASQEIDYVKIIKILLSRWYWILGCLIISLTIAAVYLWYTPPIYSTSEASLKFEEKKSEITELLKVNNFYDRTNRVESEIFVIRSSAIMERAIARLDYKVSYYIKGRLRTTEQYPNKPFPIYILKQDSVDFYRQPIELNKISSTEFALIYGGSRKVYKTGQVIEMPGIQFRIADISGINPVTTYLFKFNHVNDLVGRAASSLTIAPAGKTSNILFLSKQDKNASFAADILNAILEEYVSYDANQKKQSASQTINFIDIQINKLAENVARSGDALKDFKSSRNIVDIPTNTQLNVERLSEFQSQLNVLKIEEVNINQLEQQLTNNKNQALPNYGLGGNIDGLLSGLLAQWNVLIAERQDKLQRFTENSQAIRELDNRINEVRTSIITNIRLARDRNRQTQNYINGQLGSAQQNLSNIPSAERDFISLQADFDVNQKVFSYLSEKRLEAEISKAAVIPGATIIETAYPGGQVRPIRNDVYVFAIMVGLIVGSGLIILVRLLNPFIYDKETVENLTGIPIIGVIRKFPTKMDQDNRQILSLARPKSIFAESVRSVRTNLSFLASEKKSKVICITSEVSGEGKSFISVNLASTLALIDKKVIIIATDLRRSKLHKTFNVDNSSGLSTYLSGQTSREDLILNTEVENLHFIPSGPVPPNPSELLHTRKMKDLIKEFNEIYDFILIDTAPVGLVSDAIPVIRQADVNIFVIRAGVSKYQAANIPDRLTQEYDLKNVVIILNAFDDDALHSRYYSTNYAKSNNSYYYYSDYSGYAGSGYYNEDDKPKWWQFWKLLRK